VRRFHRYLPEFLGEAAFPPSVTRWLFDPNNLYAEETRFNRALSWANWRMK